MARLKLSPQEIRKMSTRVSKLVKRAMKARDREMKKIAKKITPASEYDHLIFREIVKPVKQAGERAFKECGLGKPKIVVVTSDVKKSSKSKPRKK